MFSNILKCSLVALMTTGGAMAQITKTLDDDQTVSATEYGTATKLDTNDTSDPVITDITLNNGTADHTCVAWKVGANGQMIEGSLQVINDDNGASFTVGQGEHIEIADADSGTGQDGDPVKVNVSTHT